MVSHLESLVVMAVVAAIGVAVASVVNKVATPLITAIFAYVGILLVFAGIAVVLFIVLYLSLYGDAEPPRSFLLSLYGVMILLAFLALWVTAWYIYPNPGARVSSGFSFLGSLASPFIILGIVASNVESGSTSKKQRRLP